MGVFLSSFRSGREREEFLDFSVNFVSFHMNGRQRSDGTYVFAGSAADAEAFVDGGNRRREVVVRIAGHHGDGSRRTVACTVAALIDTIGGDALLGNDDGVACLDGGLLLAVNGFDSTSRTHLGTARALRTTPAPVEGHDGLHQ